MLAAIPMRIETEPCIVRAHGGGGEMMGRMIADHVLRALGNATLNPLTDGAILPSRTSRIVFTTDSFVVQPLEFPGGDIGHIAVCGTVNDLAVMGAKPIGLSLGLIVEEGFPLTRLDRILASVAAAAREAGVDVVTGDTKVIEHARGDGLYINTAGVGAIEDDLRLGLELIRPGDAVLINGAIGDHGMSVMSVRNELEFETTIVSDGAPLNSLIHEVLNAGIRVRFMRDATRGGVAGVLVDIASGAGCGVEVFERDIPCNVATRAAAEMLGFDPLTVANEGKVLFVVDGVDAERCAKLLRGHKYGHRAAVIGRVVEAEMPLVELITIVGGRRVVQRPYGEELPRIC